MKDVAPKFTQGFSSPWENAFEMKFEKWGKRKKFPRIHFKSSRGSKLEKFDHHIWLSLQDENTTRSVAKTMLLWSMVGWIWEIWDNRANFLLPSAHDAAKSLAQLFGQSYEMSHECNCEKSFAENFKQSFLVFFLKRKMVVSDNFTRRFKLILSWMLQRKFPKRNQPMENCVARIEHFGACQSYFRFVNSWSC